MHVLKSLRATDTRRPFTDLREKCRKRSLWKLCLVAAWCGPVGVSAQTVIYVDQHATGPVHDGLSWCTAYVFLQDALADGEAADGGEIEIRVADGVYKPDRGGDQAPGDRTATFQLLNGVALRGGFAGCGATNPDERDITAYETTLSGDLNGDDDLLPMECTKHAQCWEEYGHGYCDIWETYRCEVDLTFENAYHVITGSGTNPTSALEGFTITAGHANGPADHRHGGGMYNHAGAPTVADCSFTRNSATSTGGGMFNTVGAPVLNGCIFFLNDAAVGGGLGNADEGYAELTGCVFRDNAASDSGAGMWNRTGSAVVVDCAFVDNGRRAEVPYSGGGLCNEFGALIVVDSRFEQNVAAFGGGIRNYDGDVASIGCSFTGNTATIAGAGMDGSGIGTTLVGKSVFRANWAQMGAAIYSEGAALALTDCTLYTNSAFSGGAIYTHATESGLRNCRFSYNSATQGGGALYGEVHAVMSLASCTFYGNTATYGASLALWGRSSVDMGNTILWDEGAEIWGDDDSTVAITYSNVGGGWPGTGNIDTEPLFVDPDGPDDMPGTEDDDFRLLPGSPCIDAGDNNAVPADVTTDLHGNPRFVDDPTTPDTGNPGEIGPPVVDMGAYEYQAEAYQLVQLDILPGQCPNRVNTRSHRVLAVAVVGTPTFDVSLVDLESLTLRRTDGVGAEVFPLESRHGVHSAVRDTAAPSAGDLCECHTQRRDGLDDLVLRFSVSDMVDLLELADDEPGSSVMLTVRGALTDATPFEVSDCIVIAAPRNAKLMPRDYPEDVAADPGTTERLFDTEVKLTASDAFYGDHFGSSVAVDGETAVVGAPGDFDSGYRSGSAYVFQREAGDHESWREVAKLTPSVPGRLGNFGCSVSIDADTIVVGAAASWGSIYVFRREAGEPERWEQVAMLTARDRFDAYGFGHAVAIAGDTVVVGARSAPTTPGAASVHIFERDAVSPDHWAEVAKLTSNGATASDNFGRAVSISGDTVIVGAHGDDDRATDSGAAYVFQREEGAPVRWQEVAKLTASDGARGDTFGFSVGISGDFAIVGALNADDPVPNAGAAYVFRRDGARPDAWIQVAKLTARDACRLPNCRHAFGSSVAVSEDLALVGAVGARVAGRKSGAAYLFTHERGVSDRWLEVSRLIASDADHEDAFGGSVAMRGPTAIVGARLDNGAAPRAGAAYIFLSSPQPGWMTGGGNALDGAVRFTYGFELPCDPDAGAANLQINWRGNTFHLTELDSAWCSDDPNIDESPPVAGFDTLEGTGTGFLNGVPGATIALTLTDAGEPGRGVDYAEFVIEDEGQLIVLSGTPLGGNHQAHGR